MASLQNGQVGDFNSEEMKPQEKTAENSIFEARGLKSEPEKNSQMEIENSSSDEAVDKNEKMKIEGNDEGREDNEKTVPENSNPQDYSKQDRKAEEHVASKRVNGDNSLVKKKEGEKQSSSENVKSEKKPKEAFSDFFCK